MVCIAHGGDHLTFNILLTNGTFCPELLLIVGDTIIDAIFREKSASSQRLITLDALEARLVEIFISHP
jgi:hypothetical protein